MISRRAFGGLLASAASFFGLKPKGVEAKPVEVRKRAGSWKSNWPGPFENYLKFRNTSYLERMNFGICAEDEVTYWGPGHHFYDYVFKKEGMTLCPSWHTRAINEFNETLPFVPNSDKRRIRYSEVAGPKGPIKVKHDDHLRDQIKDAINEYKSKGKVDGTT